MMFNNKKNAIKVSLLILSIFVVIFCVPDSNSRYKDDKSGSGYLEIARYQLKLNGSQNISQSINLKDTITSNSYSDNFVAPGTTGDIQLNIDFSNVDVSTDYVISLGTYDLPNNLRLYSDSLFTNEFSSISGNISINGEKSITHHIYWKWNFETDSASNTNDNLYMNRNLSLPINVVTSQKIGGGS